LTKRAGHNLINKLRMKYKILNHEKFNIQKDDTVVFYLLPVSDADKDYQIIYPAKTKQYQLESWHNKKIIIKQFKGCNTGVVKSVKKSLTDILKNNLEKAINTIRTMFFMGMLFILFGFINLILPDPLILIDELLIITGGTLLTISGLVKKKNMSALVLKEKEVTKQINDLHIIDNPICTKIFNSIKKKAGSQDM